MLSMLMPYAPAIIVAIGTAVATVIAALRK